MHTNTREFLLVSSLLLILTHPHPRPPSSPTFAIALKLILASRPRPTVCPRLVERRRGRGELATQPAFERLPSGLAGGGRVRRRGELDAGLAGATRALARAWV